MNNTLSTNEVCALTKTASNEFLSVTEKVKNSVLQRIKEKILENVTFIKECNKIDVEKAKENGIKSAFLDRLTLTDDRINTMCNGIDDIILLPDYVGMVEEEYTLKNGLNVKKVHAPLGVIGIIYESRPNVTVDATALCIKSGNGVMLKGGKEAYNTNKALANIMKEVMVEFNLNPNLIGFIDSVDREKTVEMLKCSESIDVIIPRGGEKLKKFVLSTATMPVIASSGGNCHIFVSKFANQEEAISVIRNAKISRPSVCNACETLLVERSIAKEFLPKCLESLYLSGVEIRGTSEVKEVFAKTNLVDDEEFFVEYEDMIIKVKIVNNCCEAIEHINKYGTHHSEAIISNNIEEQEAFCTQVDSSVVYVNASTRFTDGFELGLGAEMGISTQKLHVRGPIGLKELTSVKYVVCGNGQIR